MPDRIVRQDILTSDRVNRLSDSAEKFYRRLMSVADDYGRFDGRPSIIRASCYQLQLDRVKDSDIKKWLTECEHEETLVLYLVDNKPYLEIRNFKQRLRIMKSKYPAPSSANICGHMTADVVSCQSETKRNEVESETEYEEKRKEVRAPAVPTVKNVFIIPDQNEVREYFKKLMGDTSKPVCWPEDKCRMEADTLLDHYTANGWAQGRGKPIKDWKAACRNWVRNSLKGNFSAQTGNKKPEKEISVQKIDTGVQKIDKTAQELEYLFGRYQENPEHCTIISIETLHYDYLKQHKMIAFTQEHTNEIRQAAIRAIADKGIKLDDTNQKSFMKKIAVLEYFKNVKAVGREAVFA